MRFAFDLDHTLLDPTIPVPQLAAILAGERIESGGYGFPYYPKHIKKAVMDAFKSNYYMNDCVKVNKDVLWVMKDLIKAGHSVQIFTDRFKEVYQGTLCLIHKILPELNFTDIIFTLQFGKKVWAKKFEIHVMVDDNPNVIESMRGEQTEVIIMNHEHNEHVESGDNIVRFDGTSLRRQINLSLKPSSHNNGQI